MSRGNSEARRVMLENLGAQVVLVDQVDGSPGKVTGKDIEAAEERAKEIAQELGAYYVDQFNNESSVTAHFNHTGPEIYQEMGDSLGAFVAGIGSGGTFIGTSKYLKS